MMRRYKSFPRVLSEIYLESDAKLFYSGYVAYLARLKKGSEESVFEQAKSDLGYCTGYLSPEKRRFWMETTGVEHPMFGCKAPSAREAFNAGMRWGELCIKQVNPTLAASIVRKEFEMGKLDRDIKLKTG